jgi:hypothetical protein
MGNLKGDSQSADAAVSGVNTGPGNGVTGTADGGRGVEGSSKDWQGVFGHSDTNAGVVGEGGAKGSYGVYGSSDDGVGVAGLSKSWQGVFGHSDTNAGVVGEGGAKGSYGVYGSSTEGVGVAGVSDSWQGVYGHSDTNAGVVGHSVQSVGVWAEAESVDQPAVFAKGARLAGRFEGDIEVTGDVKLVGGGDCAELFAWSEGDDPLPGTVAVISGDGAVEACGEPYQRTVAGVVSGAGGLRPGLVLGRTPSGRHAALALIGRVHCRVDAGYGAIGVGDLITTSETPGHGMVASDPEKAFGAILGKACAPLASGTGLIPVLVALQ